MTTRTQTPAAPTAVSGPGEVVLEVRNLTKRFPVGSTLNPKYVHALTDASFTIRRGEVVALVGESGSGKSTTARLITRLMPPTTGEIRLHGQDVLRTERGGPSLRYRKQVQMIFQDPFGSLNPVHTIGDHIELPLRIHKIAPGNQIRERIHDLLNTVGLNPAADVAARYPYQLSGGQRQRVAIARALAVDPEIILADEPISMLDVSIRMGVLNLMEGLKRERGIGFLYITHDLASAGAESTELMDNPAHPYTQLLLSAVPDPHGGLTTQEVQARGEIPSLIDPPPRCPFLPRCPHAMAICHQEIANPRTIAPDHWVRCHMYGEDGKLQEGFKTVTPAGASADGQASAGVPVPTTTTGATSNGW
jgi:peptide/nickel transport system ATP-binding protein